MKNSKIKIDFRLLCFIVIISLFISIIQFFLINLDIKIFDIKSGYSFIYYVSLFNNIFITFALLWLVSVNKILLRVVYYAFIAGLFIFSYFVYNYSIVIDNNMLDEAADNLDFASTFINLSEIIFIIVFSLISIIICEIIYLKIIVKHVKYNKTNLKGFFSTLLIILVIYAVSLLGVDNYRRGSQGDLQAASINYMLYPKNLVVVGINLLMQSSREKQLLTNAVYAKELMQYEGAANSANYKLNKDLPQTLVFVFGESLNSSHFKANGYQRNTTPLLLQRKNVVFIKNTISCDTLTSHAQPCMAKPFTTNDIQNTSKGFANYLINTPKIKSFITIFNKLGYNSTFITLGNTGNSLKLLENEANKTIILRHHEAGTQPKTFEQMMAQYKTLLEGVINDQTHSKKLVIVYLNGSHYNYDDDYDEAHKIFKPVLEKAAINNIKSQADIPKVVNAYDNSVVYTDYIMDWSIEKLTKSQQNAALFFFSDHGENLSDPHIAPHGMPYRSAPKDVTNPAAFVWFSNNWLKNINQHALLNAKQYRAKSFPHDNIFHSVLNCAGVNSQYVNKQLSLCEK